MTNQTTSGEGVSSAEAFLEGFCKSLGVPTSPDQELQSEASKLLAMAPSARTKWSAEQCGEAAITLQQFAFYLQRVYGEYSSLSYKADESLKRAAASRVAKMPGYSYEERLKAAIVADEHLKKLDNERVKMEMKRRQVEYLASRVDGLARAFLSRQSSLRGKE